MRPGKTFALGGRMEDATVFCFCLSVIPFGPLVKERQEQSERQSVEGMRVIVYRVFLNSESDGSSGQLSPS